MILNPKQDIVPNPDNFNFKMNYGGRKQFIKLVNDQQKEGMKVLEVGTYDGETTVGILPVIEKNNGHYFAIDWFFGTMNPGWEDVLKNKPHPHFYDPNQSDDTYARFIANVQKAIVNPNWQEIATVIRGKSQEVSDQIEDNSIDILFIDGDHRYSAVIKDIELYLPKLKNNGIIVFDDCENLTDACNGIINDLSLHASDQEAEQDSCTGKYGHMHWGVVKAVCEVFGEWPHWTLDSPGSHGNCIAWTRIDDELMTNKKYKEFRRL